MENKGRKKNIKKYMAKLDGTGPLGYGPRTGRGLGPCGTGMRRGLGCVMGFGWGLRRFASAKNELAAIEEDEKMLEEELKIIREEKAALGGSKK